jgi:hypothetical protein
MQMNDELVGMVRTMTTSQEDLIKSIEQQFVKTYRAQSPVISFGDCNTKEAN